MNERKILALNYVCFPSVSVSTDDDGLWGKSVVDKLSNHVSLYLLWQLQNVSKDGCEGKNTYTTSQLEITLRTTETESLIRSCICTEARIHETLEILELRTREEKFMSGIFNSSKKTFFWSDSDFLHSSSRTIKCREFVFTLEMFVRKTSWVKLRVKEIWALTS